MNIQNYLLCILYIILVVLHIFTLCHEDYYRNLISVFSFALLAETIWAILVASHQSVEQFGHSLKDLIHLFDLTNFQYNAQFIHIIAINLLILFLLIVAKGWPITRRGMPFKYAFAIFWLLCLSADLTTFYWTTISDSLLSGNTDCHLNVSNSSSENPTTTETRNMTALSSNYTKSTSPHAHDDFNSTSHKLSLLLRIVIMVYFLLELRTTMILEQEKKKLQFYLNFGASSMVWLVHTLIVYVISLRVDANWRTELVSGFSAAANFICFAATTRLLWPKNPRSHLFRKHSKQPEGIVAERCEIDNYSTINQYGEEDVEEGYGDSSSSYDGLEMRDLKNSEQQRSRD